MALKMRIKDCRVVRPTVQIIVRPRVAVIRIIANARRHRMQGRAAVLRCLALGAAISARENCCGAARAAGSGRNATMMTIRGPDCLCEETREIVYLRVDGVRGTTKGQRAITFNCHARRQIRGHNRGARAT